MLLSRRHVGGDSTDAVPDHPVVQECEAFLKGRLADHLRAHQGIAPTWALMNGIAHCTLDELHATASSGDDSVESTLARAVVARAIDEPGLATIQAEILSPLECSLAGEVLSPRRLIELVGRALFL